MKEVPTHLYNYDPTLVFKYQSFTEYTWKNLEANQLWISTVDKFNDPFEFKFQIKNLIGELSIKEKEITEMLLDCGVLCFNIHPELTHIDQEDSDKHPDNMLMWAHYSDNHYGFALGLRRKVILYKVKYSDDFPIIDFQSDLEMPIQLFVAMHTKQTSWSYENEYRYSNTLEKNQGIPFEDYFELERIYFGLRTSEADIIRVKEIYKDMNVEYYKAYLKENQFIINFKRI